MVEINKTEVAVIRSKIRGVHICKTKRRMYVEEPPIVIRLLDKLRDTQNVSEEYPASK